MATQTARMTAQELFQKNGRISRISQERFNRYKGTEFSFQPLTVDGVRVVIGWVGSYPDTSEMSNFSGEAVMVPFEKFCELWDKHAAYRNVYDIVAAMKEAGAITMSMERYRAVLQTGQGLPRCEHCKQLIL